MAWKPAAFVLAIACLLPPSAALAKKKKGEPAPPPPPKVGWIEAGKGVQCFNPPDFATATGEVQRRQMRQQAVDALRAIYQGGKVEGVALSEQDIEEFEVAFLGRPEKVEAFSRSAFEKCQEVGKGSLSASDFQYYLAKAPKDAMKGECTNPLMYQLHDYLSIQSDWQVRRHVCEGDKVLIESTETSKYTVADAGAKGTKWINLLGDPDVPQAGEGYFCPGCPLGALLIRFENEDTGEVQVQAMGSALEYTAPGNGYISFTINDTTYFDNRFYEKDGIKDYLSIGIYPPVREGAGK